MWREGLSFEFVAWCINAAALVFGLALGVRGLFDPRWAAKLVRLKPDEQVGGFAEFRGTYGGLFVGAHGVALYFTLEWILEGQLIVGTYAAGAAAALAAAWICTAGGRGLSMLLDKTATRFNLISAGVEMLVGLAIAAPWVVWDYRPGS